MSEKNKVVDQEESVDVIIEREFLRIRKREAKVSDVPSDEPWAEALISKLVQDNPAIFAELTPDQRREEDAVVFLKERLKQTDSQQSSEKLYYETMDDEPALRLNYTCNADEVIEYFDPDLKLPTWLKVKASGSLVIFDTLQLLKKINVQLSKFNMKELYEGLRGDLTDIFRRVIRGYIEEKQTGYYHFDLVYGELSELVRGEMVPLMDTYGLKISSFRIEKLIISETIVDMISNEYLNTRCLSTRADAEIQWANSSLEILKRKSEIIEQYHLPQDTLSEMEKDKALERHLKKINNEMTQKQKLDKPTSENVAFAPQLVQKKPVKPVAPDEFLQTSWSKIIAPGIGFVAAVILALLGFGSAVTMIFWIVAAGCGAVAAYFGWQRYGQRDDIKAYREAIRKYETEREIYVSDLEEYEKCKKQMEDDGKNFFEDENGLFIKE